MELLISLQECVLDNVLGVFLVLRNVLGDSKYLAVVLPDQGFERLKVPFAGSGHERDIRVYFFSA